MIYCKPYSFKLIASGDSFDRLRFAPPEPDYASLASTYTLPDYRSFGGFSVRVDGRGPSLEEVIAVAVNGAPVELGEEARARLQASRQVVERAMEDGRRVYGINTGFGRLADVVIPPDQIEELQRRILLSHAVGAGNPISVAQVRAVMFLALHKLAMGFSGASPQIAETLMAMLNRRVHPYVPEIGSLGASGDLAPLAHISLVLIGHPDSYCIEEREGGYVRVSGLEAMRRAGIPPSHISFKDGLSLINGTDFSTAFLAQAVAEAARVIEAADAAGTLTLEAMLGTLRAFDPQPHQVRPHGGQVYTAYVFRKLLEGSRNLDPERVQDPYSLRCIPQIHGPARDALRWVMGILDQELHSSTDNALVFPATGSIVSAGNFMGTYVGVASDVLKVGLVPVGNASERRTYKLLHPDENRGLPAFLIREAGLNSGYMLAQYAQAAALLDAWSRSPGSFFTISTSAGQEDVISNSANAARYALEGVRRIRTVVAIELLCAAQGIDLREHGKERLGRGTARIYSLVRDRISFMEIDRLILNDIEAATRLVEEGDVGRVYREALAA